MKRDQLSILLVGIGLLSFFAFRPLPDPPTATQILEKSIAYHDPAGEWGKKRHSFTIVTEMPERPNRESQIVLDIPNQLFEITMNRGENQLFGRRKGTECEATFNGKAEMPDSVRQKNRLHCEGIAMYRDYHTYLWGLPMKLQDPGTLLDPMVAETDFNDQQVYVLTVRYDPEVGNEIWQFYFRKDNCAMVGYRFYRDESQPKGEYILLEREVQVGQMRIPQQRAWYFFPDTAYLGTDILELN